MENAQKNNAVTIPAYLSEIKAKDSFPDLRKKGALCLFLSGRGLFIQKNDGLKHLLSFDDMAGVINQGADS